MITFVLMGIGQQILFFFSALGVFNGLIVSAYLLLFKKSKTPASSFMGLLLLMLSIRIGKSIFLFFYPDLPRIYVQIGLSGCFLIGPSLYYFTKAALAQVQKTPVFWKSIYWLWILAIVILGIIVPYKTYPYTWNHLIVQLIYAQWVMYVVISGWLIRKLMVKLFSSVQSLSQTERTVLSIYIGNLVIHIAFLIVFIGAFKYVYISGSLFFTLLLYLNIPLFINKKKTNTIFSAQSELARYANKKIDLQQANVLTAKLQQVILEQELYRNPDLKLNDLAKKINISGHQLSQLLNDNLGKSFAAYLNEYRINAACELIANNQSIKLEAIGYEVGFNSKSTFYTAFKRYKHTTPTHYKEQLTAISPV